MSPCDAKDCERDAFLHLSNGSIGLCYPHWRALWTSTSFYDKTGWQGSPVELRDGRRLSVQRGKTGVRVERPPYSGLQFEPAER